MSDQAKQLAERLAAQSREWWCWLDDGVHRYFSEDDNSEEAAEEIADLLSPLLAAESPTPKHLPGGLGDESPSPAPLAVEAGAEQQRDGYAEKVVAFRKKLVAMRNNAATEAWRSAIGCCILELDHFIPDAKEQP